MNCKLEFVRCVMMCIQKYEEIALSYHTLLHKIACLPTISQKNFSGTRFSERKYFFIYENIGELGAGESLGARGILQTDRQVTK